MRRGRFWNAVAESDMVLRGVLWILGGACVIGFAAACYPLIVWYFK